MEYELQSNTSVMYPKPDFKRVTPLFKCCQHLIWKENKAVCQYNGMFELFDKESPNLHFNFRIDILCRKIWD